MSVVMTEQAFQTGVLPQAHMHGHMEWATGAEFPETNQGERRFSTLLAGAISDIFAVSH